MLQSLIFSKKTFDALETAEWIHRYGFQPKKIHETGSSFRARLFNPSEFVPEKFRTITLGRGSSAVKAVVGCPKEATFQKELRRRQRLAKARTKAKKQSKKGRS